MRARSGHGSKGATIDSHLDVLSGIFRGLDRLCADPSG